jgi:surfactin synthase thioesterase subunit
MEGMPMKGLPAWILPLRSRPGAALKLFCFPHAGGGASSFVRWIDRLPPSVQLCPLQLPGRESRFGEPAPETIEALVGAITAGVPFGDEPFVFLGHSMGALLAFEVTRRLRRLGRTGPRLLIASGSRPPQRGYEDLRLHRVQGEDLMDELRRYGTLEEVLAHRELVELIAPVIQADARMLSAYRHVQEPPLQIPIIAYGGLDDPTLSPEEMEGWRHQTSADFIRRAFPGGHHFLNPGEPAFFEALAVDLARVPIS